MCCPKESPERPAMNCRKNRKAKIAGVLCGVLVGCLSCIAFLLINLLVVGPRGSGGAGGPGWSQSGREEPPVGVPPRLTLRMPLYVGVLTMEGHLQSRADSVNRTWARDPLLSTVEYFARLGPDQPHRVPVRNVVNLTGIDGEDMYHRQASFRMLEYICEQHIEQYDWFVRAVDDVYIRPGQLRAFLATLDKDKMHYLGHPSLGEAELDLETTKGRYFCLGGPSIIFSRTTLLGLCPHIRECERMFQKGPADVELGRCVLAFLDMQCQKSPNLRERFYNSYERNIFKLAEEFVAEERAIALHPLKTSWLMTTVHRAVSQNAFVRFSQSLSWLRNKETSLAVAAMSRNHSSMVTTTVEDLLPIPITVVTPSYKELNPGSCFPVAKMTSSSAVALSQVILRSNASFLYGNSLQCRHLVDSHYIRTPGVTTRYVTNMFCTNLTESRQGVVAKAVLVAPHRPMYIRRQREREVQSKLAVFLHAYYGDPKVMEFLIMWKNILRHQESSNYVLVLFLIYNPRRHIHSTLELEFAISDLDRWKRDNGLNVMTYPFNNTIPISNMYHIALSGLEATFKDAVILIAQPHLTFDGIFLQKCRLLVRPGKHVYRPFAEQNLIYRHTEYSHSKSVTELVWSGELSPVCIHAQDLEKKKKQTKSGRPNHRPLKVIYSFDMNLRLDAS